MNSHSHSRDFVRDANAALPACGALAACGALPACGGALPACGGLAAALDTLCTHSIQASTSLLEKAMTIHNIDTEVPPPPPSK